MRTETRTVRIGEWLGPVDWSFDFANEGPNYCVPPEKMPEMRANDLAKFRGLVEGIERGEAWEVYAGAAWHEVTRVGMYDGWPWWQPYPHYAYMTWAGEERRPWYDIQGAQRISEKVS